jgi:hypothetical protein
VGPRVGLSAVEKYKFLTRAKCKLCRNRTKEKKDRDHTKYKKNKSCGDKTTQGKKRRKLREARKLLEHDAKKERIKSIPFIKSGLNIK